MKINVFLNVLLMLTICLTPQSIYPCTTFRLDKGGQLVVGYNMDGIFGDGTIIVNKRNVSKTALLYSEVTCSKPVKWTSRHGSITFNQYGCEFPFSGINEARLVVDLLMLWGTQYPPSDSRPAISPFQWVQYALDNFSSVEQVIASDSQTRMLSPPSLEGGPHFFICDSTGNCAVIEYLEGKMINYTKEKMPVKVLSNDRYDECISNLDMYKSWGGDMPVPQSGSAYDRFVRAADMVKTYDPKKSKSICDYAFSILANVKWSTPTQWSIVYDLRNLRVNYHTIDNSQIRYIDLNSFNFSCKTPVKLLDINAALSGDVTKKFTDYSYERNRGDIKKVWDIPEEALNVSARYPETTICTE